MIHPVRVTAPAILPVTLSDVKARLHVDHAEDDVALTAYIEAATRHLDGWDGVLGRCLINQQWKMTLSGVPGCIILPFPMCSNIVVSVSADGALGTPIDGEFVSPVSETSCGSRVSIFSDYSPPSLDPEKGFVEVAFTAGYGAAATDVPAPIRQAIHLMVGDMYRFTETAALVQSSEIPMSATVDRLLSPFKRVRAS